MRPGGREGVRERKRVRNEAERVIVRSIEIDFLRKLEREISVLNVQLNRVPTCDMKKIIV